MTQELFQIYHQGFLNQVKLWPIHPLDCIIQYIKKKGPKSIVGDFGCGEGRLAKSVENKVFSFDFVSTNDNIISCDISNVPLENEKLDIAVYCLSLMGTNFIDFLLEGHRTLKKNGLLKIAEVKSRLIDHSQFTEMLESIGFKVIEINNSNSHFIDIECRKVKSKLRDKEELKEYNKVLKACLYKKR